MDTKKDYQKACLGICKKRVRRRSRAWTSKSALNEYFDYYYAHRLRVLAAKYLGDDIVKWMKKNVHPLDIAFDWPRTTGIVLLNGGGFAAPGLVGAHIRRETWRITSTTTSAGRAHYARRLAAGL